MASAKGELAEARAEASQLEDATGLGFALWVSRAWGLGFRVISGLYKPYRVFLECLVKESLPKII